MTSHWDWFSIYEYYYGGMVYLNDDFPLILVGCGRVLIRFPNVMAEGINGVMNILGLALNLLPMRKLNGVNVKSIFFDKGCKFTRTYGANYGCLCGDFVSS
jgi:hypothetical protein